MCRSGSPSADDAASTRQWPRLRAAASGKQWLTDRLWGREREEGLTPAGGGGCADANAWLLEESLLCALYFLYLWGSVRYDYENEEGISLVLS